MRLPVDLHIQEILPIPEAQPLATVQVPLVTGIQGKNRRMGNLPIATGNQVRPGRATVPTSRAGGTRCLRRSGWRLDP
ncbi:MAG: hypothetical protein ACP5I4_08650 [Oceanipulchritudo sp.]